MSIAENAVRRTARAGNGEKDREPNDLLPQHRALIEGSAIAPEVAAARGYRSVTVRAEAKRLGFAEAQCTVPALLIPIRNAHGDIATYQLRPDSPRVREGKPLKYETPSGSRMALDAPPGVRPWLGDPKRPLFVTEGARKADSGVSQGLCCVALLGVWNFRGTNAQGEKMTLPDWDDIALNGRTVYIAFDSDVMEKPAASKALARLHVVLASREAMVRPIYLPPGEGGAKQDLDDYFAAGGTIKQLLSFAERTLRKPQDDAGDEPEGDCAVCAGRLGALAARIAAETRERRQAERAALAQAQAETAALAEIEAAALAALAAMLIAAGYRQHARGAWRKRRRTEATGGVAADAGA